MTSNAKLGAVVVISVVASIATIFGINAAAKKMAKGA